MDNKVTNKILKRLENTPEVSGTFYKKLGQYGISVNGFLSYAERIGLRTADNFFDTLEYWQRAKRTMKTSSGDFYSVTMLDIVLMKISFEEGRTKLLNNKSIEDMKTQLANQRDTQLSTYGEKVEGSNLRLVASGFTFDDDFYVEKGKELEWIEFYPIG